MHNEIFLQEELQRLKDENSRLRAELQQQMLSINQESDRRQADIAEHQRIEQALRESQRLLNTVVVNTPVVLFALDRAGKFLLSEGKGLVALGLRPGEVVGRSVYEIYRDVPQILASIQAALAGEITNSVVLVGNLTFAAWYSPMRNEAGEIQGVIGVASDITKRTQVEAELANEKERLFVTLRSIGDGVITTDVAGRINLMNQVAEQITGWGMDEALGKPLPEVFRIFNEETRQPCVDPVSKVLQTGAIVELANHTIIVNKNGTERVIADSGAPIRDQCGNTIGVVLVFRDITEKQKLEENLQKHQKLESLGVLAGGLAHDFNNLLTGLFGNLELARCSVEDNTEVARYLDNAFSVFQRAKDLTQQLLTFAKGSKPLKKKRALGPLIKTCANFVLSGSNIWAKLDIPETLWPCHIDENQIGQVIDNIVINAKQAMPNGGTIDIKADNIVVESMPLPPGNYVKITIRDQGCGIAKEHLPYIFDPFFTTKQQGSGLGLATAYSIIKKHDGYIDATSELGAGASFYIYLPASPDLGG